jgi:hypothetical protein
VTEIVILMKYEVLRAGMSDFGCRGVVSADLPILHIGEYAMFFMDNIDNERRATRFHM